MTTPRGTSTQDDQETTQKPDTSWQDALPTVVLPWERQPAPAAATPDGEASERIQ
jgi:hypothetical protein